MAAAAAPRKTGVAAVRRRPRYLWEEPSAVVGASRARSLADLKRAIEEERLDWNPVECAAAVVRGWTRQCVSGEGSPRKAHESGEDAAMVECLEYIFEQAGRKEGKDLAVDARIVAIKEAAACRWEASPAVWDYLLWGKEGKAPSSGHCHHWRDTLSERDRIGVVINAVASTNIAAIRLLWSLDVPINARYMLFNTGDVTDEEAREFWEDGSAAAWAAGESPPYPVYIKPAKTRYS